MSVSFNFSPVYQPLVVLGGGGGNQINFDTDITVTKFIFLVLFYMFLVVFALVCGIPVLHHSYTSCVTRSEIYPDFFTMSNV